jgi:hypothetical protein
MKTKIYFAHYGLGLLSSMVNGAIAAVAAVLAGGQPVTIEAVAHTFIWTAGLFAVAFMHAHPFPIPSLDDPTVAAPMVSPLQPMAITAAAAAPTPAVQPAQKPAAPAAP